MKWLGKHGNQGDPPKIWGSSNFKVTLGEVCFPEVCFVAVIVRYDLFTHGLGWVELLKHKKRSPCGKDIHFMGRLCEKTLPDGSWMGICAT